MRNSKIEEQDGYLGLFYNPSNPCMITVGQEQTFAYSSHDDITNGPFYMTIEQRETKKDKLVSLAGNKAKEKSNKAELVDDLMQTEWGLAEGKIIISKMLIRDLQKKATLLGITTLKSVTHHLVPGWEGNGK